jgi:hypothetical protein
MSKSLLKGLILLQFFFQMTFFAEEEQKNQSPTPKESTDTHTNDHKNPAGEEEKTTKADMPEKKESSEKDETKKKEDSGEKKEDKKDKTDKKEDSDKKNDKDKDKKDDKKDDKDKDKKDKDEVESVKIGNLALASSQQPGPLFSFGQNIIDKQQKQVYLLGEDFGGRKRYSIDVVPSFLYGISEDFSVFFNAPYAPKFRDRENHSSGWEDLFVQLEYAYYSKTRKYYGHQATIVASANFPTGSIKKTPPTGFGSPSFFIGTTFSHLAIDWYFFTSLGATLTARAMGAIAPIAEETTQPSQPSTPKPTRPHFVSKIGNQYLYQFGFGRNIPSPKDWIYLWMVEIDGEFDMRNKINSLVDRNSGGNTIFVTPSIWISSTHLILQAGIGFPILQNLYGNQVRFKYLLGLNLGWTF